MVGNFPYDENWWVVRKMSAITVNGKTYNLSMDNSLCHGGRPIPLAESMVILSQSNNSLARVWEQLIMAAAPKDTIQTRLAKSETSTGAIR